MDIHRATYKYEFEFETGKGMGLIMQEELETDGELIQKENCRPVIR